MLAGHTQKVVLTALLAAVGAACSDGGPLAPPPVAQRPPVSFSLANRLIYGVRVSVGQTFITTLAAGAVVQVAPVDPAMLVPTSHSQQAHPFLSGPTSVLEVSTEVVRPTVDGQALGDLLHVYFLQWDPSGEYSYEIDSPSELYNHYPPRFSQDTVRLHTYFAPVISNLTQVPLLIAVNMQEGLANSVQYNHCFCTIPASTSQIGLGYYHLQWDSTLPIEGTLPSATEVRAYRSGSNYTGPYIYWTIPAASLTDPSGVVYLVATTAP